MSVTPQAVACFLKEWGYQEGDEVRIYVRYSGGGGNDPFSLGVMKDSPRYPMLTVKENGMTFYMEENDVWYLDGEDLTVDCRKDEIVFDRSAGGGA
ncbi:Fe-S cluster assembly protein HesB [Paenibacillus turpanensis]|uniref:HesB/YadR/YfhF family protein n=1 Tax=Paenibacillus turpanensis TaxID=2689078 RepID=UPI0031332250